MFDPQLIIIQLCGLLRCSVLSEIQQLLDANLNKIQGPHRSIGKNTSERSDNLETKCHSLIITSTAEQKRHNSC